jgi:hypothetical protein
MCRVTDCACVPFLTRAQHDELEEEYEKERAALDAKYEQLYGEVVVLQGVAREECAAPAPPSLNDAFIFKGLVNPLL